MAQCEGGTVSRHTGESWQCPNRAAVRDARGQVFCRRHLRQGIRPFAELHGVTR